MLKNKLEFVFRSDLDDYIGGGLNRAWTDRAINVVRVETRGDENEVEIYMDFGNGETWNVELAAPKGERLRVGIYNEAQRYAFHANDRPGLTISGEGRGSNQSTGAFRIHAISFDQSGELVQLVAEFIQFSETQTAAALHGCINYYRKPESVTAGYDLPPVAIEATA